MLPPSPTTRRTVQAVSERRRCGDTRREPITARHALGDAPLWHLHQCLGIHSWEGEGDDPVRSAGRAFNLHAWQVDWRPAASSVRSRTIRVKAGSRRDAKPER